MHRRWEPKIAPFVGREPELGLLTLALGEAARGRGGAFALTGEAGIGKTRLAGEIAETALDTGLRVGFARCTDLEGAPAFWPWIEILRGLARAISDSEPSPPHAGLEELYVLLSHIGVDLPPVPAIGDEARFALLDAVVRGITRTASEKPLVLLLDDLHWADADSIVLLRELARRCEQHPLMLIGAFRNDAAELRRSEALEGFQRVAHKISLIGLEAASAARLVAWSTGHEPSARRIRLLLERSGGNPLFLRELADVPDHAPLPQSVRHAISPRLEALSPAAKELIGHAAVLGQDFDVETLVRLAAQPRSKQLEALDELLRRGLMGRLSSHDDYTFAHALIHEAAYDRVPLALRSSIHERVAALLEEGPPAATEAEKARLAHHLANSEAPEARARAVEYAAGAAELALDGLALHRAADHFGLALRAQRSISPKPTSYRRQRLDLLLALGKVQAGLGARVEARETYTEATELARALGDASALGDAAAGWIGFEEATFEFSPEALARIEEALAALEGSEGPERVGLLSLFVHILWHWRHLDRCEPVAREAVACAERVDDARMRVQALMSLHRALNDPDRATERLAISRRAVALAEEAPRHVEAMARRRLAIDLLQRGDVAEGRLEMTRVIRIWEELRKPVDGWSIAAMRAGLSMLAGEFAEAERCISNVLRLGREVESRVAPVAFAVQLFRLREHQGRLAEILDLLRARVEDDPAMPAMAMLVPLALMREDRREETRASFDRLSVRDFDDFPRDENWAAVLCAAAQIAYYLGDRRRAAQIHELLLPYEGQHVVVGYGHYWCGAAARYLALLEATLGRREAGSRFEDAIESHRRSGARPLLAETLAESGRWLADRGDVRAAGERLREAREIFAALDLEKSAARTEAELLALDATLVDARSLGEVSHPDIARLVKEGERWRIEHRGETAFVEDRKGVHDIAVLVEVPGRELHVLDLMERAPAETRASEPGLRVGAGPMEGGGLDATARASYRARRVELRAELDAALRLNDLARQQSLREEIAWLDSELRGALRGGDAPAFVQRARKAVYNRVRTAIQSIERSHPALGRHLRHGIQTGEVCRYAPEKPLRWEVGPE